MGVLTERQNRLRLGSAFLGLAVLFFSLPTGAGAIDVVLSHRVLYDGPGAQIDPRINGNRVIFTDLSGFLGDILVIDPETGDILYNTDTYAVNEQLNDIDGNIAVFSDLSGNGGGDIHAVDITAPAGSPPRALVATSAWERSPRISGDHFAFQRFGDGSDIFAYELSTDTLIPIALDVGDQRLPAVSNGQVVYEDTETGTIMLYVIATGVTETIDQGTSPDIDGNRVVYRKQVAEGDSDIFLYEIGSSQEPRNLTSRPGDQIRPTIHGNVVAFDEGSGGQYDVYLYLIDQDLTVRVTDDSSNQYSNDVGDGRLVYADAQSGELDIYVTDFEMVPDDEVITISPAVVDFGPIDVGASQSTVITVSNPGLTDFTIASIGFEDGGAGGVYAITTPSPLVLPYILVPGDSLAVEVTYAPATSGYLTDDLTLFGPTLTSALRVALSGTGLSGDNQPPVAVPCCNSIVTAALPTSYYLSGELSFDPDNHLPLNFSWEVITKPEGSTAGIQATKAGPAQPILSPIDLEGEYIVELVATDSLGLSSAPAHVTIRTHNSPPEADAGADRVIYQTGANIGMDGSQSYDPEGDEFQYAWELASRPSGSTASLSNPESPTPAFVADVRGDYIISLTVTDIFGAIGQDEVVASFENIQPVAEAGQNQAVAVGETVALDGSGSSDANGDSLSFSWTIISAPDGSSAVPDNVAAVQTSFIAGLPGIYIVQLVVNDGELDSAPAQVTITATVSESQVVEMLSTAITAVNLIDPGDFKNYNMQNALTNKINEVIAMVDQGQYPEALDKLENDIIKKTDGCAAAGVPDKNDWIRDCGSQSRVYLQVLELISLLRDLV